MRKRKPMHGAQRKRRKRTNANVPAKGLLREFCDDLWSLIIRRDWAGKCAVCGSTDVNAHHMVPRGHEATRYDLTNGIALCTHHHIWDNDISPHLNAAGWLAWLNKNYAVRAEWYMANRRPQFTGTTNAAYFIDVLRRLQPYVEPHEFVDIVGVKFAAWLEETREETEETE